MAKRIEWIDIAKGVAIILVVLGHATGASIVGKYIYCFHMPLFFIISGMCFNSAKYSIGNFIAKRFRQLIIPALLLTIVSIIIYESFGHTFDMLSLQNGLPGALWFLPVLFFVEIVYFVLSKSKLSEMGGAICFATIGVLLSNNEILLPYSINSVPTSIAFYGIGHLLSISRVRRIYDRTGQFRYLLCIILLGLPFLRLALYPHHLYLFENTIVWLDFIVAPLVSLGIFLLAIDAEKLPADIKRTLIWLGKNTMMIMAIHLPIMKIMGDFRILLKTYVLFKLFEEIAMWSVSCLFAYLANKYFPWMVGKKVKN